MNDDIKVADMPVAYMYQHSETGRILFRDPTGRFEDQRWYEIPLYIHYQPSSAPMTEEAYSVALAEIDRQAEIIRKIESYAADGANLVPSAMRTFLEAVCSSPGRSGKEDALSALAGSKPEKEKP